MGVSLKGKTGANASIHIWKVRIAQKTQTTYIKQYAEAVHILDICANESRQNNPTLAIRYGINQKKKRQILTLLLKRKLTHITKIQNLLVIEIQIDKKVCILLPNV